MPYIDIKVAGSLTEDQKSQIANDIATTMERVANKPKSATYICIHYFTLLYMYGTLIDYECSFHKTHCIYKVNRCMTPLSSLRLGKQARFGKCLLYIHNPKAQESLIRLSEGNGSRTDGAKRVDMEWMRERDREREREKERKKAGERGKGMHSFIYVIS